MRRSRKRNSEHLDVVSAGRCVDFMMYDSLQIVNNAHIHNNNHVKALLKMADKLQLLGQSLALFLTLPRL